MPVVTYDAKSDLAYKKLMASGKFTRQLNITQLNKKEGCFDPSFEEPNRLSVVGMTTDKSAMEV